MIPPRPVDFDARVARRTREIAADLPHNDSPLRTRSPAWRDDSASTPSLPPERCTCKGFGPSARPDGYRFDSAGVDCPCPDCGAKASDHHLRVVGGGR